MDPQPGATAEVSLTVGPERFVVPDIAKFLARAMKKGQS